MKENRLAAVQLLKNTGACSLVCNGRSMEPIIFKGQKMYIRQVPISFYQENDIVFCKVSRSLTVHKIEIIKDGKFLIANNHGFRNGWISEENIFGIVVAIDDSVLITDAELTRYISQAHLSRQLAP